MKINLSRCPKCKKNNLRCKVSLFLDIPMSLYGGLNKQALRQKALKLEGADWPRALFYCECGYNHLSEGLIRT